MQLVVIIIIIVLTIIVASTHGKSHRKGTEVLESEGTVPQYVHG